MPNYTEFLNLEKPLQSEQYNVDVFNDNCDKIDNFAKSQIVPIATTETAGIVKPDGTTITVQADGTISSEIRDDFANQDLTNLTTLGNARLQYAPFAINQGTVDNGENTTLHLPEGSQAQIEVAWVQPTLSSNGTMGGDSFAVIGSPSSSSSFPAWKAVDGANDTCWMTSGWNSPPFIYIFYNPVALKVTKLTIRNDSYSDSYVYASKGGSVQGSNDGNNWTTITTYTNSTTSKGAVWNIDLSNNTTFYKYYRIYSTSQQSYAAGSAFAIGELQIEAVYTQTITAGETIINDPCTITTADGRTKVFDISTIFDVSATSDEDYSIFKDYSTGALSLISDLTISKTVPATPSNGDYWLDMSTVPTNLKYYDTSDWVINNDLVYIGDCTVSSGAVTTISNRLFNDSGYLIERNCHAEFNAIAPDWSAGVSKSTSGFTADEDGWLRVKSACKGFSVVVYINTVEVATSYLSNGSNYNLGSAILIPINNGDVVTTSIGSGGSLTLTFYPLKGVN